MEAHIRRPPFQPAGCAATDWPLKCTPSELVCSDQFAYLARAHAGPHVGGQGSRCAGHERRGRQVERRTRGAHATRTLARAQAAR